MEGARGAGGEGVRERGRELIGLIGSFYDPKLSKRGRNCSGADIWTLLGVSCTAYLHSRIRRDCA